MQRYITRQSSKHPRVSHMKTWQDQVVVYNNLETTLLKNDEKLVSKVNKTEEILDELLHKKKKCAINIFTD